MSDGLSDNFFHLGKCDGFAFDPSPDDAAKAEHLAKAYNSAIKAKSVTIKCVMHEFDENAWIISTYPKRYG